MKGHWRTLLLLASATAVLILGSLSRELREPVYREVTLTSWLAQLDGTNRDSARIALVAMAPRAAAFLLQSVRRENPIYERVYRRIWPLIPQGFRAKLRQPHSRDGNLILQKGHELAKLGPSAVPVICTALVDGDDGVRMAAVIAITRLGPEASAAIPKLRKLLSNSNPWLREHVVVGFASSGSGDTSAYLELLQGGPTKAIAAWVLGKIGPMSYEAVPEILSMLGDKDVITQQHAAVALWRVSGRTNGLPVLISTIQGAPDLPSCCRVLPALGEMGKQASVAVPAIQGLLDGKGGSSPFIWQLGREALSKIDQRTNSKVNSVQKP